MSATTYTIVKRQTKNNGHLIVAALADLAESMDWLTVREFANSYGNATANVDEGDDIAVFVYRNGSDYVAIPEPYTNEGAEFTTLSGKLVIARDGKKDFEAVEVE